MRIAARLMGVLLLTAGLAACDTEEVLQLASQNGTVSFKSIGVDANYFDIWEAFEDNDNDDLPDAGTTPFLWCIAVTDQNGIFLRQSVRSAPWQYSFRLSILRAGETQFEPLTSDAFLDPLTNFTPFDDRVIGPMTSPNPPNDITETDMTDPMNPVDRTFKFRSFRNERLTALNADVVIANRDANTLHLLNPTTHVYGEGLCSTADALTVAVAQAGPVLAGAAPPFSFDIGKGDTIRVEATKHTAPLPGLVMSDPALTAEVFVDGVNAGNFLVGASGTGTLPGESLSFTYTSR